MLNLRFYILLILTIAWLGFGLGFLFPYAASQNGVLFAVLGFIGIIFTWLPILFVLIISLFDSLFENDKEYH